MTDAKDIARRLPKEPGVYLMKDAAGKILYVGKAINLYNRVMSYFRGEQLPIKTSTLVSRIMDIEVILATNEVEALLLERTLIKHHAPPFNILLRDDKEYPIIRIDYNDPWPRIQKVRKKKDDGATYIGPFGHSSALNTNLKTVGHIFPLVRCSDYEFKHAKRPCNYYHMNMCLAPCTKEVDQSYYLEVVKSAELLLRGKNHQLQKDLRQAMLKASDLEDFEKAAQLRDQISALEATKESQAAITLDMNEADIIGVHHQDDHLVIHIISIRNSLFSGSDTFHWEGCIESIDEAIISYIMQYYENRYLPPLIITPIRLENAREVSLALTGKEDSPTKLKAASRRTEIDLIKLATKNAVHHFNDISHMGKARLAELELLREMLKLSKNPERIECIDISNHGKHEIVASVVTLLDGRPAKNLYKKYKIKTVGEHHDDFRSIEEVVDRRLARGLRELDLPDLLVIDGGKGQLSAALKAKSRYPSLELKIISLAKSKLKSHGRTSERVFLPNIDSAIPLKPGSACHRILTRIRDEAHRFAIRYHRQRRRKNFKKSWLDDIPGIGPKLKKNLLERFGSLEALSQAAPTELAQIKGISLKLAHLIKEKCPEE